MNNITNVLHRIVDLMGSGRLGARLVTHYNRELEGIASLRETYGRAIVFKLDTGVYTSTKGTIKVDVIDSYGNERAMTIQDVYGKAVYILVGELSQAAMFFSDSWRYALYPILSSVQSVVLNECQRPKSAAVESSWAMFVADFGADRRMSGMPSGSAGFLLGSAYPLDQFDLSQRRCEIKIVFQPKEGGFMRYDLVFESP